MLVIPRSNKTSSVLKLIGAETENIKNNKTEHADNKYNIEISPENTEPSPDDASVPVSPKKYRRKTVIKKPRALKLVGSISASNPMFRNAGEEEPLYRRHGNERQIVNVSALLICEQLAPAIDRFNSCECDLCCRIITEKAIALMPDCFILVNTKHDEDFANKEIKRLRPEAVKVLTRLCLTARARPYHNY